MRAWHESNLRNVAVASAHKKLIAKSLEHALIHRQQCVLNFCQFVHGVVRRVCCGGLSRLLEEGTVAVLLRAGRATRMSRF